MPNDDKNTSSSEESSKEHPTRRVSEIKAIQPDDLLPSKETRPTEVANAPDPDPDTKPIPATLQQTIATQKPGAEPSLAKTIEQKAAMPEKATPEPQVTAEIPASSPDTAMSSPTERTAASSSTIPFNLDKTGAPKWLIYGGLGLVFLCAACTCVGGIGAVVATVTR